MNTIREKFLSDSRIRQDVLDACSGAKFDPDKLRNVLPERAFVAKNTPRTTGPTSALIHRFWKPHNKYTFKLFKCKEVLKWLITNGSLLESDPEKFVDLVMQETQGLHDKYFSLSNVTNAILDLLYTADMIKPSKLTIHKDFTFSGKPKIDYELSGEPVNHIPEISRQASSVYKQSNKEKNNPDYDLFEENDMNIYEQLNKINDTESLSEKYNVKNVKELKKLSESQTKRAKKIKLNESLSDTQNESLKESSNGKQDVRHEAQTIHDELIKKGYTDEEIDSIIRILHTSAINNFEPARPKLKAAFPDLDI